MTPFGLVLLMIAIVAGVVVHELLHAAVARALRAEVAINFRRAEMYYRFDRDVSNWHHRAVGLAPVTIGGIVLGGWLIGRGSIANLSELELAWLVFLIVIVFLGGREDYRLKPTVDTPRKGCRP